MMNTSIIEHLLLALAKKGYAIEDGCQLEPCPEWGRIDDYCRSGRFGRILRLPLFLSDCRRLGRRLGLSVRGVILLLAVIPAYLLSETEMAHRTHMRRKTVLKLVSELESSGHICRSWCMDMTEWRLSTNGVMSLIAEMPIRDLESAETMFRAESDAYPYAINTILSLKQMDPVPVAEKKGEENAATSAAAAPAGADLPSGFFERLGVIVERCSGDECPIGAITYFMNSSLDAEENAAVRAALASIGYDDLDSDEKAFLFLLCHQFLSKGTEPMVWMANDNPLNRWEDYFRDLLKSADSLVSKGIAVIPPREAVAGDSDSPTTDRYLLSPDVVGTLFSGRDDLVNLGGICRQGDVIKASSIEKKTLYFSPKMEEEVGRLRFLLLPESAAELLSRLREIGRKSLTCLFYGSPGVGKTELARQLAAETGRDIIIADIAKLTGSYVGESEKNVREIFRSFKYLAKLSRRAPILLFNEADGILSKRFSCVARYNEKSENAVQGIILQELETFEGIFIAMTNLELNLDEAAERRFLYKLKFETPSADIRARIIRDRLPWMRDADARAIGAEFELSGGQIDNIASKCIIEKFISGAEPTIAAIRDYCAEETAMGRQRRGAARNPIGFIYR